MKINKLLIFVLIVFLIATVCVGCNNKSSEPEQQGGEVVPASSIVYDQEVAEDKYLKERISDATAIYYKSSLDGQYGDDRYLFERTLLPKEFTELDYIQSTGSQCIDTGIYYADELHFDLKFSDYTSGVSAGGIFGTEGWMFSLTRWGSPTKLIWCVEQKKFYSYNSFSPYKTYTVQCGKEFMTINGIETIYQASSGIYGTQNITLFKSNTGYASVKLYYFKIYDGDDIVRNYIPCYRNYDKAVGLYDLVTERFYCNSTETNFEREITPASEDLPDGYQQVEYIQSSGSQYIDTGFSTTDGMRCQYKANWQTEGYICGSHSQNGPYGRNGGFLDTFDTKWELGYGDTCPTSPYPASANTDYVVEFCTTYENAYLNVNGETIITSSGQSTSGENVLLFACGWYSPEQLSSGFSTSAKLYYCKIWNADGVLVRDFIPCYRKSDGTAGVYDLVNKGFYTNVGSGAFVVGKVVKKSSFPKGYQPIEYISTSGTQYITTDVVGEAIWEYDIQYDIAHLNERQLMGHGGEAGEYWGVTDGKYGKSSYWGMSDVDIGNRDIFRVENYAGGGNVYINGDFAYNNSYDTRCEHSPAQIFAINGMFCNYCNLYGCKVYDKEGELIRNYVPCYRKEDNAAGLYDLVKNKFYVNEGTGVFGTGDTIDTYDIEDINLPSEYTQVEYIKSTGTQYIDTGYLINATSIPSLKVIIDQTITKTTNVWSLSGTGSVSPRVYLGVRNDGQFGYGAGNAGLSTNIDYENNTRLTYTLDIPNARYKVTGSQNFEISINTTIAGTAYRNFYLFGYREETETIGHTTKMYSCKMYQGDTLIRYFVPCVRKSDSIAGLYDIVNNVFYTNEGTGTFEYGNPVNQEDELLPIEYERVDYIQSSGNGGGYASTGQEIALGIPLDMDNDSVEITFQSTMIEQDGLILATHGDASIQNYAYFYHYISGASTCLFIGNDGQLQQIGGIDCDLSKHTMIWRNKQLIMDGVVLGEDTRELGTTTYEAYLCSWGGQYHYSGKIFRCKIWKSGELVRNMIPCYRKADSETGMYDLVNNVFYTNTGSGAFVPGLSQESLIPGTTISPLAYLEEYEQIKYLTSAGEQYIDTEITPSNDVVFEIAFGTDNLLISDSYVLGNGDGDGIEIYLQAGLWKVAYGSEVASFEAIPTTKTTVILVKKMLLVGYNDSSPTLIHTFSSTITSTRTLTLFATNRESEMLLSSGINIYGFRMMTGNSMCEYVPSIQKEDGTYGMYDGVQDKLLGSNGSAEFISSQEILSKLLPDGYHMLEYIESSGTQYIDTGIKDSSNTLIEVDFLTTSLTSVFGTTTGMGYTQNLSYMGGYFYYLNRSAGLQGKSTINKRMVVKMNNNLCYRDDTFVYEYSAVSKTDTQTMFLFARNKSGTPDDMGDTKLYSCKIYENKMIKRYFVPACRDADGEIGLYELVTETFCTNEGEGEFDSNETENIYKDTVLPTGYRQLEYIEGTGTQYFDTGIIVNKPDYVIYEGKIQYTSTTTLWTGANPYLQMTYSYYKTREPIRFKVTYDGAIETLSVGGYTNTTKDWTNYNYIDVRLCILGMGDNKGALYNSAPQQAKVYYIKVTKNNELVFEGIPCYRESDGEAGLFDLVSQKFMGNLGTGSVVRGKEVNNISNEYEQVDYVEYTGTQQINIPYAVTSTTKVEISIENNTSGATNEYPLADIGGSTLGVANNIPTYNVFDTTITGSALITNTKYLLTATFDKDNALIVNGTVYDTDNITLGTFGDSIKLFGVTPAINGTIKVFRIKVYEGDKIALDLIPCSRKYDGKIGLFDYVNSEFYVPTSGDMECNVSFEAVKMGNLFKELDYIYLDDEHYLNLSYVGNTKFIFDAQFDATASNGLMGYTKIRDLNWGVMNGKYVFGATEQYVAGNRDIITDEYTASSIIRSLNGEVVATLPLTVISRGAYRIGSVYDNKDNCAVKIYSIKVEQNGKIIAEFVPMKRKSDQSIGLLDKITNVFYVVYSNKDNFVMGNVVGHHFDTNNVVTEVSESHDGDISHVCSICGTEIHETKEAYAYKVDFMYGTGVKEVKVYKGYDLSTYETTNVAYTRNKNTNNFSRRDAQVYFEVVLDEGYEIEKIYPGDAVCTNYENNIYIVSEVTSETTVKILARKHYEG